MFYQLYWVVHVKPRYGERRAVRWFSDGRTHDSATLLDLDILIEVQTERSRRALLVHDFRTDVEQHDDVTKVDGSSVCDAQLSLQGELEQDYSKNLTVHVHVLYAYRLHYFLDESLVFLNSQFAIRFLLEEVVQRQLQSSKQFMSNCTLKTSSPLSWRSPPPSTDLPANFLLSLQYCSVFLAVVC